MKRKKEIKKDQQSEPNKNKPTLVT